MCSGQTGGQVKIRKGYQNMKRKMFVEALKKYSADDVAHSRFGANMLKNSHKKNVLLGLLYFPVTFFRHGISLFIKIFLLRKTVFPSFELVVTTRCSLRCKHCANLMPYYAPAYDIPAGKLYDSIDKLMELADEVVALKVLGGEPFLYKEIADVIEYLAGKKIHRIVVATNGTVMCTEPVIRALKKDNVTVDVSDYGYGNVKKLCRLFRKNGIHFTYNSQKQWYDIGDMNCRNRTPSQLQTQFRQCFFRCRDIFNGYLYQCPRSAHGEDLKLVKHVQGERFNLDYQDRESARVQLMDFYWRKKYISACGHCDMGYGDLKTVPAGEQ